MLCPRRFLANRCLRRKTLHSHATEQHVEWMYAFDVHCNSYFPLFLLLYGALAFLCTCLACSGALVCLLTYF